MTSLPAPRVKPFINGLATRDIAAEGLTGPLAVYAPNGFLGVGHFEASTDSIVPDKVYQPLG